MALDRFIYPVFADGTETLTYDDIEGSFSIPIAPTGWGYPVKGMIGEVEGYLQALEDNLNANITALGSSNQVTISADAINGLPGSCIRFDGLSSFRLTPSGGADRLIGLVTQTLTRSFHVMGWTPRGWWSPPYPAADDRRRSRRPALQSAPGPVMYQNRWEEQRRRRYHYRNLHPVHVRNRPYRDAAKSRLFSGDQGNAFEDLVQSQASGLPFYAIRGEGDSPGVALADFQEVEVCRFIEPGQAARISAMATDIPYLEHYDVMFEVLIEA